MVPLAWRFVKVPQFHVYLISREIYVILPFRRGRTDNMPQISPQSVRLIDVARAAGVSRPAAGKVLLGAGGGNVRIGEETARRIRRVAEEMGYRPNPAARQLNGKGSKVLGVVIGAQAPQLRSAFLAHLERETALCGYRLVIAQAPGGPDAYRACIDDFACRGIDGVLCIEADIPGQEELLDYILTRHRHVVFHTPLPGEKVCYVGADRARAMWLSVEYLLHRGYRRIGLALTELDHHVQQERLRGYTAALEAHRNPVTPDLIWVGQGQEWPDRQSVQTALAALVKNGRADAVIANNDYWGMAIVKYLKQHGLRVPADVAVIGCDNLPVGTLIDPELTTVDMQNPQVAARTIHLLVALIEQAEVAASERRILIEPALIVRDSA